MPRVILIEDDALVRTLLMRRMLDDGWDVTGLADGRDLEQVIHMRDPDLLVVDLGLPYIDGFALVEALRARGIRTPVLVISGYELPHLHEAARNSGADDVMQKPFDQDELIERMSRLLAA